MVNTNWRKTGGNQRTANIHLQHLPHTSVFGVGGRTYIHDSETSIVNDDGWYGIILYCCTLHYNTYAYCRTGLYGHCTVQYSQLRRARIFMWIAKPASTDQRDLHFSFTFSVVPPAVSRRSNNQAKPCWSNATFERSPWLFPGCGSL